MSAAQRFVQLTPSDVCLPAGRLLPNPTPSTMDGMRAEDEYEMRMMACKLIETCGILLRLPQKAMSTGQMLFHRFCYAKSMVRYRFDYTVMASLNLAAKINESPCRVRDVINVFEHAKQVMSGDVIRPIPIDASYAAEKEQVIRAERRILKELGFCVFSNEPHKLLVTYLRLLHLETNQKLVQSAWDFLNDSFWTDVCLRHRTEVLICSAIFLAARRAQMPIPSEWLCLFSVGTDELEDAAARIILMYCHKLKPLQVYRQILSELRDECEKAKVKNVNPPKKTTLSSVVTVVNGHGREKSEKRKASSDEDRLYLKKNSIVHDWDKIPLSREENRGLLCRFCVLLTLGRELLANHRFWFHRNLSTNYFMEIYHHIHSRFR